MKLTHIIIATGLVCLPVIGLTAQAPTAPEIKLYAVKDVLADANKLDKSDTLVRLEGTILEQIDKESFWFQDASGKIRIEIEEDDIPISTVIPNTKAVIIGEVDHDLLDGTEIEVEQFTALPK